MFEWIKPILPALLGPIINFFIPIFVFLLVCLAGVLFIQSIGYKDSAYQKQTGKSFLAVRFDQGAYGEYLIYQKLRGYEEKGAKFLFNVYVPKENGETTEIDVLMIDKSGIFVFESKNYSGWIFGSEKQTNWTQTLPVKGQKAKNKFFNPVIQNNGHIKHLRSVAGEEIPMFSVVVFSDNCELKKVQVESVPVVCRRDVVAAVEKIKGGAEEYTFENGMESVYNMLYPMTQVDASVKVAHIEAIKNNHSAVETEPAMEKTIPAPDEKESMICPRCGRALVARMAKKGANAGNEFYGCSGYPHCRYVKTK
jgi:ssDNA-binding Zn-finger/Zn-ribbon topoisomerase 1